MNLIFIRISVKDGCTVSINVTTIMPLTIEYSQERKECETSLLDSCLPNKTA